MLRFSWVISFFIFISFAGYYADLQRTDFYEARYVLNPIKPVLYFEASYEMDIDIKGENVYVVVQIARGSSRYTEEYLGHVRLSCKFGISKDIAKWSRKDGTVDVTFRDGLGDGCEKLTMKFKTLEVGSLVTSKGKILKFSRDRGPFFFQDRSSEPDRRIERHAAMFTKLKGSL